MKQGKSISSLKTGPLEIMIDHKVMTVHAGSCVMVHAGTKHDIMAITDCNMITVGCAVLSGHHCRYFEE